MKTVAYTLIFAAFLLVPAHSAAAASLYGTLSNFDVYNDTGQVTHGFEIELDGITSSDVVYSFTANRYGNPQVVPFGGGVYVRWASGYSGLWSQTTPMAPAIIPTGGHQCVIGSAGYDASGCEHFGVATNGNATATVYRWLIADPATAGNLVAFGTNVSIAAPIWTVVPNPAPAQPPIVQVQIVAEPPDPGEMFGEAQWVKVFVTELPNPADLDDLVDGNPIVPGEAGETEIEWFLLQKGAEGHEMMDLGAEAGAGAAAVIRKYEFYKYTGAYSAEGEAQRRMCGQDPCSNAPEPGELGNYIGSQIAAVNLVAAVPEPGTWTLLAAGLMALAWRMRAR